MMPSIKKVKKQAEKLIKQVNSADELEQARVKVFGRKGLLQDVFKSIKDLSEKEKQDYGKKANQLKDSLEDLFNEKQKEIQTNLPEFDFDPTEPGLAAYVGKKHILTTVRKDVENYFKSIGFDVVNGPEIESDYYNFEALNIPADHPARDMWDTFWIKDPENSKSESRNSKLLLRTHTSPVQVRIMEDNKPPLAVVVPGRIFRHEATDATHEHTFDQIEGFLVDEDINAGHLKYILHGLYKHLFGGDVEVELRPSYFPFTEPSFELFMKDQRPGNNQKWLEMLGCGMIHPHVFKSAGYPEGKYTGFAFGLGLARIALLKYNIPDIRMFYENDLRFLRQF